MQTAIPARIASDDFDSRAVEEALSALALAGVDLTLPGESYRDAAERLRVARAGGGAPNGEGGPGSFSYFSMAD
jgi:hypothetical protein